VYDCNREVCGRVNQRVPLYGPKGVTADICIESTRIVVV